MSQNYVPAATLEPEKRATPKPAPANAPRTPNFINDVAAGKVELPSIPRVVQQVAAAIQDPDVDARKDDVAAAWAALPDPVRAQFGGSEPDAAFEKLYDALRETDPKL